MFPYWQTASNYRLCLAPQLNFDRAGQWEDGPACLELESKTLEAIQNIEIAYRAWRLSVTQHFFI